MRDGTHWSAMRWLHSFPQFISWPILVNWLTMSWEKRHSRFGHHTNIQHSRRTQSIFAYETLYNTQVELRFQFIEFSRESRSTFAITNDAISCDRSSACLAHLPRSRIAAVCWYAVVALRPVLPRTLPSRSWWYCCCCVNLYWQQSARRQAPPLVGTSGRWDPPRSETCGQETREGRAVRAEGPATWLALSTTLQCQLVKMARFIFTSHFCMTAIIM